MKKVLFLGIALMVIIGCGTQVEKIDPARKAFEEAYKAKMDFPETYEFLKMEKLDSATYQDILNTRKNYLDRMSFAFDQEDYDKLSKVQNNLADTAMNVATYLYKFIVKGTYPMIGEATPEIFVVMTSDYQIVESNILESEVTLHHYTLLPGYKEIVMGL